jgi:hypothetical protein
MAVIFALLQMSSAFSPTDEIKQRGVLLLLFGFHQTHNLGLIPHLAVGLGLVRITLLAL